MKKIIPTLLLSLLLPFSASAQIENENKAIPLHSTVCEKITNGESRSSARMRATDKASFKAVESISELKTHKDTLNGHNFNLNVYKLVDNYLEDIFKYDAGSIF